MSAKDLERRAELVRRIRQSRSFRHLRGMAFFAASVSGDLATVAAKVGAKCAVCEAAVTGGTMHGDEFLCQGCSDRFERSAHANLDFWLMDIIVRKPKWLKSAPQKPAIKRDLLGRPRRPHWAHRDRQPAFMRRHGRNKGSPPTRGFNSYSEWKAWKKRHDWPLYHPRGGRRSRHLIGLEPRPKWGFFDTPTGWEHSEWLYAHIAEANAVLRPARARIYDVNRTPHQMRLEVVIDWDTHGRDYRIRGRVEDDLKKIIGCDCRVEVYKAWNGIENTNSLDVYFQNMRHQEAAGRRFWAAA